MCVDKQCDDVCLWVLNYIAEEESYFIMRYEIVRSMSLDLLVICFSYSCCAVRGVSVFG